MHSSGAYVAHLDQAVLPMNTQTKLDGSRALVLFSGGQDSTVCLGWALEKFDSVETIGFDYGQRHRVELECRPKILAQLRHEFPNWSRRLGDDHILDLTMLAGVANSALTSDMEIKFEKSGLPNTFVPGRNILFLTAAAGVAYRRDIKSLVGGMCETDYSGYPDCRHETLLSLNNTLRLGMDADFETHTPLMFKNKADAWEMAKQLGGQQFVDLIIEETHTCYLGDRENQHAWGYGCGGCPACELRAKGYEEFNSRKRSASG